MPEEKFPLLKGKMAAPQPFQSRKLKREKPFLPPRNKNEHMKRLVRQLNVAEEKAAHQLQNKVEGATHSLFAIKVHPESDPSTSAYSDRRKNVEVVWDNPETHTVLIRSESPKLGFLEKKIEKYGDKIPAGKKEPPHKAAIAPVSSISLAVFSEIKGEILRKIENELNRDDPEWFEIS